MTLRRTAIAAFIIIAVAAAICWRWAGTRSAPAARSICGSAAATARRPARCSPTGTAPATSSTGCCSTRRCGWSRGAGRWSGASCRRWSIEASWEMIENTPMVIDRYRETTAALGYIGDSVLNSMSDITMMASGFLARAQAAASGRSVLLASRAWSWCRWRDPRQPDAQRLDAAGAQPRGSGLAGAVIRDSG